MKDKAPFLELPNNQVPENYPQKFVRSTEYPNQYKAHDAKYKMAPPADVVLKGMK